MATLADSTASIIIILNLAKTLVGIQISPIGCCAVEAAGTTAAGGTAVVTWLTCLADHIIKVSIHTVTHSSTGIHGSSDTDVTSHTLGGIGTCSTGVLTWLALLHTINIVGIELAVTGWRVGSEVGSRTGCAVCC